MKGLLCRLVLLRNTGTLTINGNVTLDGGALSATINSANDYDKVVVNGAVNLLNNPTLSLSGGYVVPAAAEAQRFELLGNDVSDAITGNFSGPSLKALLRHSTVLI